MNTENEYYDNKNFCVLVNDTFRRRDILLCVVSPPERPELDVDVRDNKIYPYHPVCHLLGFIKLLTEKGREGVYRYDKDDEVIRVLYRATKPDTPRFIQAAYIFHMIYQERAIYNWFYYHGVSDRGVFSEFVNSHLLGKWQDMLNCDLGGSLQTVVQSLQVTYEAMIPRSALSIGKLKLHHTIYNKLCRMYETLKRQQEKENTHILNSSSQTIK